MVRSCVTGNGVVGGKVGKVSAKFENSIVPGGWAFSIWGMIYTLVFMFSIYQAVLRTPHSAEIVRVPPARSPAPSIRMAAAALPSLHWLTVAPPPMAGVEHRPSLHLG